MIEVFPEPGAPYCMTEVSHSEKLSELRKKLTSRYPLLNGMPRSVYHFLLFKKSLASSRILSLTPTSRTIELKGRLGRDVINLHSFLALDEYMEINSSFAVFQAFFASSSNWLTIL